MQEFFDSAIGKVVVVLVIFVLMLVIMRSGKDSSWIFNFFAYY